VAAAAQRRVAWRAYHNRSAHNTIAYLFRALRRRWRHWHRYIARKQARSAGWFRARLPRHGASAPLPRAV